MYYRIKKKKLKEMVKLRQKLCEDFKLEEKNIELSMGMSGDFEEAVNIFLYKSNIICNCVIDKRRFHKCSSRIFDIWLQRLFKKRVIFLYR